MKTLKEVRIGDTVIMVKLHGAGAVKCRTMGIGITRGAQVFVRKIVPLGDPTEVRAQDYELSLHKADAELTEVN